MQKQQLFFRLAFVIGMIFLFSQCKKETENNQLLPPAGDAETWVDMANEDIASLGTIVKAIEQEDLIEHVEIDEELVYLHFVSGSSAKVRLDYANYPSPLVGAHLIDDTYYWTIINGTGTSAVRLIKDKDRHNYAIKEGKVPNMLVNNAGNWAVSMEGVQEEIFDADGKPFRAIGRKSLFSNVIFDIDSNATITTNEAAEKSYLIRRDRPFTFLFDRSENQVLTIASGFAIAVDFRQVGVQELEFDLPTAWFATYELNAGQKSGVLQIISPTGMEADFAEEGVITIRAKDQYGRQLVRRIPVKVEVGVVNYASMTFTDIAAGVELTGATFTFAESLTSTNVRDVTAIKAGDAFRLMIPDGFPELRKATFVTPAGNFDYYFKPNTYLVLGEQNFSLAPPQRGDYWKGGMIVHINETLPLSGIAAYRITGKVMHVNSPTANIFFQGPQYLTIPGSYSVTDGRANTIAINNAVGGNATNRITQWAVAVRDGGYNDWYLGAVRDYEYFHDFWAPDPFVPNTNTTAPYGNVAYETARIAFNNRIASFGGNIKLRESSVGGQTLFWTSTTIVGAPPGDDRARQYDTRYANPWVTGEKRYGSRGLAFRDF